MPSSFEKKFEVEERLEGKFCDIIRLRDKTDNKIYIGKKFKQPCRKLENLLKYSEVVIMKNVPYHPNLFGLLDYHVESFGDRVTFLYDLVDINLRGILKTVMVGIQEKFAKKYMYQLIQGLSHLHTYGFFHRNICPENILVSCFSGSLSGNEIFKLSGLENSRGIYSAHPYTEYITSSRYKAPECILTAGYYGPKIDIWALGCVFYEMLKQKQLFRGHSDIDQLEKIHNVLGTPKSLMAIKSKSSKQPIFKKQLGIGLPTLLSEVSTKGVNVIKSMVMYEPDLRINAKRLLKNSYFTDNECERYRGRVSPEMWTKRLVKSNI